MNTFEKLADIVLNTIRVIAIIMFILYFGILNNTVDPILYEDILGLIAFGAIGSVILILINTLFVIIGAIVTSVTKEEESQW